MNRDRAGKHKGRLLAIGKARATGRRLAAQGYRITYATAGRALETLQSRRYEAAILSSESIPLAQDLLRLDPALALLLLMPPEANLEQGLPQASLYSMVAIPFRPGDPERATEELLARRQARRRSKGLDTILALLESSQTLPSETQLGQLFQLVVETTAAETQADWVSLMLLEGEELVAAATLGLPGGPSLRARVGEGIAGRVAKKGAALLLPPEGGSQPGLRKLLRQGEVTSALCLPLIASDHVLGVLYSGKTRPGPPFSREDLDLLSGPCGLAAMAVQNARLLTQLHKEKQRSKALLRHVILAQERERRRISLEIHDGAAQWIVGASYHAQAARAALPNNPSLAQDHLEATHRVLNQTIKEIRLVVGDLHGPDTEGSGLLDTLREMMTYLKTKAGLLCKVSIRCQEEALSPETRIAVYRIAQEALRNVQKHAQASRLEFRLSQKGEVVVMIIADNGRGFSLPTALERASKIGHVGLLGMRERAEALGGTAIVTTQPGQGTRVGVRLPLAVSTADPGASSDFFPVLRT